MGKRWIVAVTVLLVGCIVAGWYFFAKESRYFGTSPFKAVPVESPFFIRVRNFGGYISKTAKNAGWKSFKNLANVADYYDDIVVLDSLAVRNKDTENFLRNREILFARNGLSKLFVLPINSIAEKNQISDFIRDYFQSRNFSATEDEYRTIQVQKFERVQNIDSLKNYVAIYKGLLIASNDYALLCKSLDQIDSPSVADDKWFKRVNNNAAENIDLNIYINHKTFPSYLAGILDDTAATALARDEYARWTEVDVIQKDNQLLLSGITVTDSISVSYMGVFRHQKPVKGNLLKYMPSVTSYFAVQNLSDPTAFFQDYSSYLEVSSNKDAADELSSALSGDLGLDIREFLKDSWTGEAAAVFLNFSLADASDNRFLLIKLKPGHPERIVTALRKWMNTNKSRFSDSEMIDARKNNLYGFPAEDFGKLLGSSFGKLYTPCLAIHDDCLLLGPSPGSLKRFLTYLRQGDLLMTNASFNKFSAGTAATFNYYAWSSPGHSLPFFSGLLAGNVFQNLQKDISLLRKMEHVSWQWGNENGVVYNSAFISFNPDANQGQFPIWKYALTADFIRRPVFVSFSEKNSDNVMLFQDRNNNLVCLDGYGQENWRLRLEGPVMGEIQMIDIRKQGDYQMLFNTKNAIHLVDRNGSAMRNFPVRLRSAATNAVIAVDFDGRKDYRFLVACRDRKIYNFDKYGKLVNGWQAKPSAGTVEQAVCHFRSGSRDLLVYSDKNRTYIVDRQGKERLKLKEEFVHSANGFFQGKDRGGKSVLITTSEKGIIRIIGPDGTSQKLSVGNYSPGHRFLILRSPEGDITNFLFADQGKLSVFDSEGNQVFSKQTDLRGNVALSLIKWGNEELIELYSATEKKTVCLKKDGSEFNPDLPGQHVGEIVRIHCDSAGFANILTRSNETILSNFQVMLK